MRERACYVEWEGDDPAVVFSDLACIHAQGIHTVLDAGCGDGHVSRCVAGFANEIIALDISLVALNNAARTTEALNVTFVRADVKALPFANDSFDLVFSRSFPGSETAHAFSEMYRTMRAGAVLLGTTMGELHRIETQEVFGRGLMWPPVKPVRFSIPETLQAAGLEMTSFAEYYGRMCCPDITAFTAELDAQMIIPGFDADKDAALLREIARKLTTECGIQDTTHTAVFAAWKPG